MSSAHGAVRRERGLEAEMPDGVVLVADAWYPEGDGPWPVLVQRLPYGRSVASTPALPHPSWLARHGYVVVVQDVRGRGDSGGAFAPFVHAAADGAATIEWAARLDGSNGDVATYGFSYQGILQLYAAAERPPSLRAIAPMMCAADPYEGWTYEGGALRWPFVCFWAAQLAGQESGTGPVAHDPTVLPAHDALGPDPPLWFRDWLAHPDGSAGYWAARRPDLDAIDVPALVVAGWFDDFSSATLRLAEALDAELVIGPWAHMPWGTRAGTIELDDDAAPGFVATTLVAFFDRVLKSVGGTPIDKVRYNAPGSGWHDAPGWPVRTTAITLHAGSAGNANSRHGDGVLTDAPAPGLPDVIVVEPLVAYPGDETPLSDEGPAEDRRDVCCYTSEPFVEGFRLVGASLVEVTTRSDRPSHDVVVSVVLVEPDSPPRRLATGVRRLLPSTPDAPRTVTIELRPIAWEIPAGARLRLDVSGARFPAFDRNPHTDAGQPTAVSAGDTVVATVEILGAALTLPAG